MGHWLDFAGSYNSKGVLGQDMLVVTYSIHLMAVHMCIGTVYVHMCIYMYILEYVHIYSGVYVQYFYHYFCYFFAYPQDRE